MKNHVAYKLQGEEVNALYANALVANISVIITVILFLLIAKVSGLGQAAAIIWALSMIAVAVLRLLLYRLRLVAPDKYSSKDLLKTYTVLTGVMGFGWATSSLVLIIIPWVVDYLPFYLGIGFPI